MDKAYYAHGYEGVSEVATEQVLLGNDAVEFIGQDDRFVCDRFIVRIPNCYFNRMEKVVYLNQGKGRRLGVGQRVAVAWTPPSNKRSHPNGIPI
jgi:hypothetical protein